MKLFLMILSVLLLIIAMVNLVYGYHFKILGDSLNMNYYLLMAIADLIIGYKLKDLSA